MITNNQLILVIFSKAQYVIPYEGGFVASFPLELIQMKLLQKW
jgi:hypothetical protein